MKKWTRWKKQAIEGLEFPRELLFREAVVTITGDRDVFIENYSGILKYNSKEIVISTARGKILVICGGHLEISWFTPEEMLITGYISAIFPKRS